MAKATGKDGKRVPRKDRRGVSPFKVGAIAIVLIAIVTYLGFTKDIPFTSGFQVKAVFTSANSIRIDSPVRIAGVNVGKVVSVDRYKDTNSAVVTMEIDDNGLPIHKDAQLKIRPRIFLEGNFFVDLRPGSPNTPEVHDGDTIPVTQTATPVQLDQVLTSLQQDTRGSLQSLLIGLGVGLDTTPTAAEDATQDPQVRGKTGGEALNQSLNYSAAALKGVAIVNQAVLGTQPNDLSKLVTGLAKTSGQLASREVQLQDLVTNFNTTMAATASQSANLSASIRLLAPTLANANRAFTSLNAAFPSTRAFAREIIPGVEATPATIAAAMPWLAQAQPLLGSSELGGVLAQLQPTTESLARTAGGQLQFLPQITTVSKCISNVILPAGDLKISDGAVNTGKENYKEFWYSLVGLASEGQNYDGNGQYVHFQVGGGPIGIKAGPMDGGSGDTVYGNFVEPPLGTAPKFVKKLPPFKPTVPCYKQALPNVKGPLSQGPPDQRGAPPATAGSASASAAKARRAKTAGAKGALAGNAAAAPAEATR